MLEEICAFTGNIEPHYIAAEDKNPLTEIDETLKIKEQPYKNLANSHWMNEIRREAADLGVGVLLNGQVGNATVSWGMFDLYLAYLLKSLRLRTLHKEIKARSALESTSPARLLRSAMHYAVPYRIKKIPSPKKRRERFRSVAFPRSILLSSKKGDAQSG